MTFNGKKVKSHKFVLAARSDHWSNRDLNEISELELTGDTIQNYMLLLLIFKIIIIIMKLVNLRFFCKSNIHLTKIFYEDQNELF